MAEFCIGWGTGSLTRAHLEVVVCSDEVAVGFLRGMAKVYL